MKKNSLLLLFLVITIFRIYAHVDLNNPKGGEIFYSGDTITIEWQIAISHDFENWDLYFSDDDGSTWEAIQLDIPSTGSEAGTIVTYKWVVPEITTSLGLIKIVMGGTSYLDISETFTITSVTNINSYFLSKVNIYPNPITTHATFEFDNHLHNSHILKIFNSLGQIVLTKENITTNKVELSRKNLSDGLYYFNLFNKRETIATGRFIIK